MSSDNEDLSQAISDSEAKVKLDEAQNEKDNKTDTETDANTEKNEPAGDGEEKTTEQEGVSLNLEDEEEGKKDEVDGGPKSSVRESSTERKGNKRSGRSTKRGEEEATTEGHKVTFTITIAQAYNTAVDEEDGGGGGASAAGEARGGGSTKPAQPKKKRVMEAPKAQNYFHFEYLLMPEGEDPVRSDVVTYGIAAKIYTEKQEPKVLKTWRDGDYTWVAWTHCHTVTLTEELLLKMFHHKLELRIWDTKDKVSTRARFDRPRAFRLPQPKPGQDEDSVGGVKALVLKQSRSFESVQPKSGYINRALPNTPRIHVQESSNHPASKGQSTAAQKALGKQQARIAAEGRLDVPEKLSEYMDQAGHNDTTKPDEEGNEEHRIFTRLSKLAGCATTPDPNMKVSSRTSSRPHASATRVGSRTGTGGSPTRSRTAGSDGGVNGGGPAASDNGASTQDLTSSITTLQPAQQAPPAPATGAGGASRPSQGAGGGASKAGSASKDESRVARVRRNKRLEQQAAAQAEEVRKNGLCCIPIRLAKLFAGGQTLTERVEHPVGSVEDVFFTVSISGPLMTEETRKKLNPMVIKVHSATNMPQTPYSYEELATKCEPAYVKYQFLNQPENRSMGRPIQPNIYWDDVNVFLTGTLDQSELREYLHGPPLQIQVHDRDRSAIKKKLEPTLFGDDLEDEKISNTGVVSSKHTLHNPFDGNPKPWDPYGIAEFDLSGLLLGQQVLYVKSAIQLCPPPDILNQRDELGVPGAGDRHVDAPLKGGHYLDSQAMLKIKVEIAYPLVTPQELATQAQDSNITTEQCPYGRMVFRFDYKNTSFLHRVQSLVMEINADALELGNMPTHIIETALSTYKLSIEQQQSRDLDIVTGFHVLDGSMHLFVLEGLKDRAILKIWDSIPKPFDSDVEVLYHSSLAFGRRLYGPLDVDVCRIKLHESMEQIVRQPLLYVRDMLPKPCFQALIKLNMLRRQSKLRDAIRADLFPSADMVVSMSREFGVPLTAEDFEELQPPIAGQMVGHQFMDDEDTMRRVKPADMYGGTHPSRQWTPIDNYNEKYLLQIEKRERGVGHKNYHQTNMDTVHEQSVYNSIEKARNKRETMSVPAIPTHNYSTQTLNSTEQAKEALRKHLQQETPDRRYTYCPEFHHSMTVVPANVEAEQKAARQASKQQYRTPNGFTYPGKKTMIQSNRHPNKPDIARVEELQDDWNENSLHAVHLEPTLALRETYPWPLRKEDMDNWTKPVGVFGPNDPVTIHLAGEKRKQERLQAALKDHEAWKQKIIVDDPRARFHRLLPQTELRENASNQLDRQQGMLKDPPSKLALKRAGFRMKEIPPLNVVLNPSVDTAARSMGIPTRPASVEKTPNKGFMAGPFQEYSWTLERNHLPVRDYEHDKYKETRGQDFNVYHKERSGRYKRPIPPLTDKQYDADMFRWPSNERYTIQFPRSYTIPDLKHFKLSSQGRVVEVNNGGGGGQEVSGKGNRIDVSADSGLGASLGSRQNTGLPSKEVTFLKEDTIISDLGGHGTPLRKEATMA